MLSKKSFQMLTKQLGTHNAVLWLQQLPRCFQKPLEFFFLMGKDLDI